jgi:hypothetical protein
MLMMLHRKDGAAQGTKGLEDNYSVKVDPHTAC